MAISFIPSKSVLSGGIVGLAVWGIGLLLQYYGIPVSDQEITGAVTVIGAIVTHFVPDSTKDIAKELNVKVEDLAALVPTTYQEFPGDEKKTPPANNNLNQG